MMPAGSHAFPSIFPGRQDLPCGSHSQKVLTDSLRSMESDGLITRTVYPEVPPRVEYALNDLGKSLKPILDSMVEWGNAYKKM